MSARIMVYAVQVTPRQVEVPDACPQCVESFTEPTADLQVSRLQGEGFFGCLEPKPYARPGHRLSLGERHHGVTDESWVIALTCGGCGFHVAAPSIAEVPA